MTEQTPPIQSAEEQQTQPATVVKSGSGRLLSLIAIALVTAMGAGLYYHGHQQVNILNTTLSHFKSQLDALQKQQAQSQANSAGQLNALQGQLDQERALSEAQANELAELKQQLASVTNQDSQSWLLTQADFMVKMAGRKLWNEQDILSAVALLKSADSSLADLNDPSILQIRRLLTEDIATLSSIEQIDFDGIILQLNQLADQIDNLPLADQYHESPPMDENSEPVSSSLSEWKQNISRSWHRFMSDFVTIRRRDANAGPLLSPEQDLYLRENIRARLLMAAQAVPRHQNETYKLSLDSVTPWVRAYFNTEEQATKAFLSSLETLSQQSIHLDVPETLQSQEPLELLMKKRVRSLLAQPAVNGLEE